MGHSFLVLRTSRVLASSLGIPVYQMKLAAYALGAIPGGRRAPVRLPQPLSRSHHVCFDASIVILAASVLGGAARVYGAVAGAIIMQLGPAPNHRIPEVRRFGIRRLPDRERHPAVQGLAGWLRPVRRLVPSARVQHGLWLGGPLPARPPPEVHQAMARRAGVFDPVPAMSSRSGA